MTSKHLELRLSDEELEVLNEVHIGMGRAIADAATRKAAWAIHDWVKKQGFRTPSSIGHVELHYELTVHAGIQRPEATPSASSQQQPQQQGTE